MRTIHALFPTLVYAAPLQRTQAREFNRQLLKECRQLRLDDAAGRRWSLKNYPGGYTSYGSAHRLQTLSPTFDSLRRKLKRHVAAFSDAVEWDLSGRELEMTDCWVNIMPRQTVHSLHLHPHSTLSGTYYVQVPRGSPGTKFEDPRLDRLMAAPSRKPDASASARPWITFPAAAGHLVLFESWLRHEVVANAVNAERISVSFNYNWF
ncbi:MAG TPA: TIGR02466 family protein [Steroidobacteraceae bacterium]